MANADLLTVKEVSKSFFGVQALDKVSLTVKAGELISIIGPNGAGKTTLFNLITGIYRQDEGAIFLKGKRIDGLPTHKIAHLGIARTFQNLRLFKNLYTWENVALTSLSPSEILSLLKKVGLEKEINKPVASLPYGLQRRCELARALALKPEVLLLDEPTAGMNPAETNEMIELIRKLNQEGLTILLIEHDMKVVMNLSSHIIVLDYGQVIAEGRPEDIRKDKRVIAAYLGKAYA